MVLKAMQLRREKQVLKIILAAIRIIAQKEKLKEKEGDVMYIPPFWCGFIAGFIAAIIAVSAWCEWYNKRHK